jgi:hypothetical protein
MALTDKQKKILKYSNGLEEERRRQEALKKQKEAEERAKAEASRAAFNKGLNTLGRVVGGFIEGAATGVAYGPPGTSVDNRVAPGKGRRDLLDKAKRAARGEPVDPHDDLSGDPPPQAGAGKSAVRQAGAGEERPPQGVQPQAAGPQGQQGQGGGVAANRAAEPETDTWTEYINSGKYDEAVEGNHLSAGIAAIIKESGVKPTKEQVVAIANLQNAAYGASEAGGKPPPDLRKAYEAVVNGKGYDGMTAEEAVSFFKNQKGGDRYVQRSAGEGAAPSEEETPAAEEGDKTAGGLEYPVDDYTAPEMSYIPDFNGARSMKSPSGNAQLAALAAGFNAGQYNKAKEELQGAQNALLERNAYDLQRRAEQVMKRYENETPEKQRYETERFLNAVYTDEAYSPQADGIPPQEAKARYEILNRLGQGMANQIQRQSFKIQQERQMVSLQNESAAVINDVYTGKTDVGAAFNNLSAVLGAAGQYLSPIEKNKVVLSTLENTAKARLAYTSRRAIENAQKTPGGLVTDVEGIAARNADELMRIYGEGVGYLGTDKGFELFKIEAVIAQEAAVKELRDYNAGVFTEKQAEYERALNVGGAGAAGFADEWRPRLAEAAQSGMISIDDGYRTRDFFKPVTNDGRTAAVVKNTVKDFVPEVLAYMGDTTGAGVGMSFSYAAAAVSEAIEAKGGIERADGRGYWSREQVKQAVESELFTAIAQSNQPVAGAAGDAVRKIRDSDALISGVIKEAYKGEDKGEAEDLENGMKNVYLELLAEAFKTSKSPEELNRRINDIDADRMKDVFKILDITTSDGREKAEKKAENGVMPAADVKTVARQLDLMRDMGEAPKRTAAADDNYRYIEASALTKFKESGIEKWQNPLLLNLEGHWVIVPSTGASTGYEVLTDGGKLAVKSVLIGKDGLENGGKEQVYLK